MPNNIPDMSRAQAVAILRREEKALEEMIVKGQYNFATVCKTMEFVRAIRMAQTALDAKAAAALRYQTKIAEVQS